MKSFSSAACRIPIETHVQLHKDEDQVYYTISYVQLLITTYNMIYQGILCYEVTSISDHHISKLKTVLFTRNNLLYNLENGFRFQDLIYLTDHFEDLEQPVI